MDNPPSPHYTYTSNDSPPPSPPLLSRTPSLIALSAWVETKTAHPHSTETISTIKKTKQEYKVPRCSDIKPNLPSRRQWSTVGKKQRPHLLWKREDVAMADFRESTSCEERDAFTSSSNHSTTTSSHTSEKEKARSNWGERGVEPMMHRTNCYTSNPTADTLKRWSQDNSRHSMQQTKNHAPWEFSPQELGYNQNTPICILPFRRIDSGQGIAQFGG